MKKAKDAPKPRAKSGATASARCLCGAVELEIGVPVFWAWHDHSAPTRRAHGAAYATYVGCWKSRVRVIRGEASMAHYKDDATRSERNFCARCGTPLTYLRGHSPAMINIPRALIDGRTGREPLYHIAIEELQEWTYTGEKLGPLKGYPGVVWARRKGRKKVELEIPGLKVSEE